MRNARRDKISGPDTLYLLSLRIKYTGNTPDYMYLFGQVSIQDDNSRVKDEEKCLQMFSVLHVTGGNSDKQ